MSPDPDKASEQAGGRLVSADDCIAFITELVGRLGAAPQRARLWAQLVVETSLLGLDTHGVRMLERYVNNMADGGIDPRAEPSIVRDSQTCVVVDARGGAGHLAAEHARSLAVERARRHGTGCVAVRRANHVGACGVYVRRAALDDCVALCSAVTRPAIAPWGGIEPMVGTNPIALAAPVEGRGPFVLDMATSVTAMGKVTRAKDLGESIPPGWALDRQGNPTTDPAAATVGSLLPIGGHKGYGLAMAMEILASMLSGGALAGEVESWIAQTRKPTDACFTVVAMDLSAFGDPAEFKRRMADWVGRLGKATLRPGFERIYYPGEIEDLSYHRRLGEGIPLHAADLAMLGRLAQRFGIPCPFL